MNKFFSDMTPQQKKIFYVAVAVVVLALFDRLLIAPTTSRLAAIDQSIANEENSIKGDLRFLTYKDRINKEYQAYQSYISKEVPKEDEVMASFLEKLDHLVTQSNLTLIKNNRSNDQADSAKESPDYFVYKADLEASGELEDIAKFMYAVNTSQDLFKILKMNLAMKKNGDVEEMRIAMTVAKYIMTGAPAQAAGDAAVQSQATSSAQ